MRFRNTLHIFVENFKNVYKVLLFKLIIGVVAGALLCALILPELVTIAGSEAWKNLAEDLSEFVFALNPGHNAGFESAKNSLLNGSLPAFGTYLLTRASEIVWVSIGVLSVSVLARFFETVCLFALGDTLDDKMQTYGDMTYSSSFVKNFARASKYAFAYVPFSFLFDVVAIALCYLSLLVFKVFVGLFFSVIVLACAQAFKLTIACFWMPAMTADRLSFKEAVKKSIKSAKGQFWKTFSVSLILVYVIIAVNVLAVICTFASALVLTIPASYVLLLCFQYVNYYTVLGRKYFITFDLISVNDDKGNSESLFEKVLREEEKKGVEAIATEDTPTENN